MMTQNFSFMWMFEDRLFKDKNRTSRPKSEFRLKCNIGDVMHCYCGMRTDKSKWIGDGEVIERIIWNINNAPFNESDAKKQVSPRENESWYNFAILDGFKDYQEFLFYFDNYEYNIFDHTEEIEINYTEKELDLFKKEMTHKKAIFRGKITKAFIKWLNNYRKDKEDYPLDNSKQYKDIIYKKKYKKTIIKDFICFIFKKI